MKFSEATRKHLDGRFSEFEMFQMFNVECDANADPLTVKSGQSDLKIPLWVYRKREKKTSRVRLPAIGDTIKDGVTNEPPGSKGRVEALRRWHEQHTESAFKE